MTKEKVTLLGAIAVGRFALIGWLWWLSSWLMEQYALLVLGD